MDDNNKRGRLHREWIDNTVEWYRRDIWEFIHSAIDHNELQQIVKTWGAGPMTDDNDDDDDDDDST